MDENLKIILFFSECDQAFFISFTLFLFATKADEKIELVKGRSRSEETYSLVKVLGDHSVLYRYLNPNIIFVATSSFPTSLSKNPALNIHLVDSVTGEVLYSQTHLAAQV